MYEVEHVLASNNGLGEGPLWHVAQQTLHWIDFTHSQFFKFTPDTGRLQTFDLEGRMRRSVNRCSSGRRGSGYSATANWLS
jgi:sugar lactone lactonase YvrE